MDPTMAGKKPHSSMGVFEALSIALSRPARGECEALLTKIGEEVPNLGILIGEQASAALPSSSYRDYLRVRQELVHSDNNDEPRNAPLVRALFSSLPRATDKLHPEQTWQPSGPGRTVEALVLDDALLDPALAGAQGKEIASFLLADLVASLGRSFSSITDGGVRGRIDKLLDHADPQRIAYLLVRANPVGYWREQLTKPTKAPGNDTQQRLDALLTDAVLPALEAYQNRPKDPAKGSAKKLFDPPFPEASLTLGLLEAQDTLRKQLKKQRPEVGQWLDRGKLWAAVRNTGLQEAFVVACLRAGAMTITPQAPTGTPAQVSAKAINPLLDGVIEDAPEVKPAGQEDAYAARSALLGYINSITHKNDLVRVHEAFLHASKLNDAPMDLSGDIAQALARKASEYPLAAQDAVDMGSGSEGRRRRAHLEDVQALVATMAPARWTLPEIDALWQREPKVHNTRMLMVATVAALGVDGFDQLAPESARRAALAWPYASGLWGMVDKGALGGALRKILDRVPTLSEDAQAQVAARYLVLRADNDDEGGAQLDTTLDRVPGPSPSADMVEQMEGYAGRSLDRELVARVQVMPNAGRALARVVDALEPGHYETGLERRTATPVARLLGYGSGNDKQQALAGLGVEQTLKLLGLVVQTTRQATQRGYDLPKAVLQNIVFDLVEHLPTLEPALLTERDLVVQAGYAQAGERLSFEGACVFLAPFLSEPRPAIDVEEATKDNPDQQQDTVSQISTSPLGKDDILQRLNQPPFRNGQRGGWETDDFPGREDVGMRGHGYGRIYPPLHPAAAMMLHGARMGRHPVDEIPLNVILGHMRGALPFDAMTPAIARSLVGRDIAQKLIEGTWFATKAQPTAKPGC